MRGYLGRRPAREAAVIVSLLGRKPNGKSEFSYYSFRGGFDRPSERPGFLSFQQWLDSRYGPGKHLVLDYPTVDTEQLSPDMLDEVSAKVLALVSEGRTVVVVDSGGVGRTGRVCHHMGLRQL